MKAISVSVNRFLLAAALLLAGLCLLFTSANEALAQACPGADDPPTPTEVAVTAAPIAVESTSADYFVLYASHDVDGETLWHPVRVTLGEDGTTTLAENVAPLPVERYRVEKYSIAEPADVDSDCTDDITELNDLGPMNPVNPGESVQLRHGAVAITNHETFERLGLVGADGASHLKFIITGTETVLPSVYFQNTNTFKHHIFFLNTLKFGVLGSSTATGIISYDPNLVASDGSLGVYRYSVNGPPSLRLWDRIYTLFGASLPVLDDNLALRIANRHLPQIQDDLPLFQPSRMNLVFDEDVYGETDFQALNPAEGYGLLRSLGPDERPNSRDVVIYETLPNELPRVAGIISTVPQTPLSHVNLRALQDSIPNAFIRDALEDDDISGLIDSYVYYAVTENGYSVRAATQAEVEEHYASSRPAEAQTPQRDLSVTAITPLSEIGFDDWDSFGVKAANLAVLRTLGLPEGTVPSGFAVPFYFYDEFMKHNDLYDYIEEMLEDSDFQSDYDEKVDRLKKLRKKIKKAETPEWIETALTAMHATFPEDTSLRYRSSTNNEDLPNFNGAGLYDSKTQHPEETEEDGISKSLKQVYASLWNFRAFIERDFHRVDHLAAAMGVLVHPNYSDEPVNGVAVSVDPAYGTEGTYYVNSQVGEDLVTNPEANSAPEEVLLYPDETYTVFALSNQVLPGQLLMTDDQLAQLRRHLAAIHERFGELYGVQQSERFAMEIEFKITSDNVLAIKQARPWVFTGSPPAIDDTFTGHAGAALTARFRDVPATHYGSPFKFRIDFSEIIAIGFEEFTGYAMAITGGSVTKAVRVDDRGDLWHVTVDPDSDEHVTIVLTHNRHCLVVGAICTADGRRLSTRLERTVRASPPPFPGRLTGKSPSSDTVKLNWKSVPGIRTYEVQYRHTDTWIDLPADGAEIAFNGAGAVVSGLPVSDFYYFRVRSSNSYGASEWSPQLIVKVRLDWESELTPGQDTSVLPVELGYAKFGNLGGTLSPDEFVLNGTTYTVQFLAHWRESLWLGTSPELPADFTLFVGDSDYRGRESKVSDTTIADAGYWWPSAPLDWSADDPVPVGLLMHPGNPLGDRQNAPVTGHFRNYPPEHDGNAEFSFRIYFSEGVPTTADALRDHVLSVSGGAVSGVEAVGSEGRIWAVSVTPESHHPVAVGIEADLDCQSSAAICTGDGRRLFNRMELTVEPREKNPATGAPTISGTVEPGQTLTADTSGIADADGLTGATFTYQWVSYDGNADTDIPGATSSTYTLVPADAGKAFRVRVLFTDDAGNSHSLTSPLARSDRPYGLNASESDGAVVLTWRLPAGWTGSTFQILRNRPELGETEPQVHVRYIQTAANTYTDADVEPGVQYVYRVKGVDPFGYTGAAPARPNVVIILADDLGWGDVQTNNPDSAMTTPRIDGIAAAGANFADAHSPSSACTGTRYGLLTGRYSWRSWLSGGVLNAYDRPLIGPDRPTLGTLLQGHGYRTAAIGKWHLGMNFTRLSDINGVNFINRGIDFDAEIVDGPIDHGFDEFFGTGGNLSWSFPPVYIRDDRFTAVPKAIGPIVFGNIEFDEVLDRLTEEAVAFIEREGQTDEPFFLYMPLNAPHGPLAPNDDFLGSTDLGRYGDFVAQVDWSVGQVLDTLRRVGEYDNTMVIFTSDNGSNMNRLPNHVSVDHTQDPDVLAYYVGTHQFNGEWKHGKGSIYEGGHRMPFLLQWPAAVEAGSAVDATVSLTDLYATLADILGQNPGPGEATDSVSLLPLLSGEAVTRGAPVVHHSGEGEFAIRDGRWKLVFHESRELYDLEQDPVEQDNLAAANPEVVARLEASLARIRAIEDGTLSGDATLRDLRLVGIDIGEFAPDALTYTAIVGREIETVEVMAIPTGTDARASISTPEGRLLYGKPRRGRTEVELAYPTTTIVVNVVSPDTSAATTYTATVTRSEAKIGGTAMVGETLTADTLGITDPDGLTGATFSYQWTRHDGSTDSDIVGATSPTYVLATEDEGKSVLVRVSFIDDVGNAETQTSPPTPEVEAGLTAQFQSVPEKHEGSTPFVFRVLFSEPVEASYQTLEEHSFEVSNGTIVEARRVDGRNDLWEIEIQPRTHAAVVITLPPTADCADTGAVCASNGKRLFTRLEITVAPPANSPPQGMPTVSGAVEVGETLAADTSGIADADGLTGATFTYQWVSYDGNADTDIPGATSSTYTLVPANEGKAFKVRVSFTDDAGFEESLVSALARSERPYGLNASESDGAVVLTWKLPAGWTGSTFQILRNRPELGETEPQVHVRYIPTAANTYTDADVEPGVQYVYRVKGVDPFGYTGEASHPFEIRTEDTGAAPARPNVVIILADDLGWGDVQTNNPDSAMTTPRIDGIAAAGAYFTDAHTPSATCSPTRYGLLTGRYAWRSWLKSSVLGGHDRPMIGADRATLGTLLQGHGYRTAAVGKWHVGMDFTRLSNIDEFTPTNGSIDFDAEYVDGPLDHGFDEFFGTSANLGWPPSVYIRDRRFLANPDREGQPASGFVVFDEVLDRHAEEAVAFIEREGQTEEPFFLYLPLNAPHKPLAPNAHFDGLTGLGAYADVVSQIDWTVGQVLDALERVGVRDNTLVVFTSDNGSSMGGIPVPNHAHHQSNGGWRGGKGTIHEGGHRVPLLMQWPRGIETGTTVDATVSLIDMYDTLADIVGEEPEQGVAIDSVSLLPLLRGEAVTRGAPVVHHSTAGMFALRDGRWKLVFGNGPGLPWGGQSEPFVRPWELFDLEQNPRETNNLADSHPMVVARMSATLERIRAAEDATLSADATLRVLNLAGIDIGPFDGEVRSYDAIVDREVDTIGVSAIPTAVDAHVKISDASGSADKGHRRMRLAYPATTIKVTVTSPDKSVTTTYTVTVTRSGVTVVGTPQVWETLSVDTSGVADADGLTGATFGYQWVRNDGGTDTDIVGATSPTYVLATEDEGKSVKVRVSFTDDGGNAETRTSPPMPEVEPALTAEFQRVPDTHESTTFVFHVLFSEPVDASYQALREHSLEMYNGTIVEARRVDGRNDMWEIEVLPSTHAEVVVTLPRTEDCADAGAVCTVDGKRLSSRLQMTVAPSANSPPRGAPIISGTVEPGHTLTSDTSGITDDNGLTGATFIYQWVSYDGNADTDIPGATSSTYTLVPADEGNAFRVRVLFTDDAGNSHSLTSPLARSERPYGLNASESDGAVVLTWRVPVGWTGSTFQILRNRPELGETEPLVHVRFTESGMTTYTDTDVEPGVLYVYRVKGVDPFGYTGGASQPFDIRTEDTGALPARPNVVIILADDLGWGDIQTNNADSAMTTPRIDAIASAGVNFTDAHSPSSMCSPTRYGLLTGRYAWRTWLTSGVLGGHDRPMIGPDRATLGTLLQDHGYRTAAIGKWHVGMDFTRLSNIDEFTPTNGGIDFDAEIVDGPLDHGFNEFFGTSANLRWEPHAYIRDRRFLADPSREGQPASGFYEFKDVLDRLTEEAVAFIEREGQTEAPFFLYLPVHTPHVPLIPNDHFDGLTGLGHYADVVAQLDWAVGQVLDTLDRVGARDDTLVIFTSDNGSFMEGIPVPNHLNHWSSGRWRGGKGQIHEGGHRVPLLMQWPRGIEAGSTVDATVSLTDMYATLADIVGEEAAPGVALDSVSLLPLLRGEDVTRGVPVVHHSRTGMFALRDGYWKLVLGNGDGGVHGTNTGEPFGRPWRLIDLERDHKEKTNAAKDNPQVVARMEAALERLRAAEDGTLSADATLRSLNLAGIDIGPFDPGVRTYAATVAKRIENIAVSAIPTAMDAHVTISDANGSANKGHRRVRLAYPATTIEVTVTSPDSSATTTYTVTVTRSGVTVVGTPQVWETLSVDTSGVADADGLTGATFGYQWVRNDGGTDTDIVGATSPTYVLGGRGRREVCQGASELHRRRRQRRDPDQPAHA